jgi:hypothetical protein
MKFWKFSEPSRTRWIRSLTGAVLGLQLLAATDVLMRDFVLWLDRSPTYLLAMLLGAWIGRGKGRVGLWIANGILLALIAVIGFTPVAIHLMRGVVRSDPLRPMPAVVALSGESSLKGGIGMQSQNRLFTAYRLLQEGYASRLVLTRAAPPWKPYSESVRSQMREFRMDYPVDEVGPVVNTHDEAVAVADLARRRGWPGVLLVSQGWHLRRAGAVFEKAGVRVVCVPAHDWSLETWNQFAVRLTAFRCWLHEAIGYQIYRRRGWIGS